MKLLYAIAFLATGLLTQNTFATSQYVPNSDCTYQLEKIQAVVETEYGRIPYEYVRLSIDTLGDIKVGRTVDLAHTGRNSRQGEYLNTIHLDVGNGIVIEVDVLVGHGSKPNYVSFNLAGSTGRSNTCR